MRTAHFLCVTTHELVVKELDCVRIGGRDAVVFSVFRRELEAFAAYQADADPPVIQMSREITAAGIFYDVFGDVSSHFVPLQMLCDHV